MADTKSTKMAETGLYASLQGSLVFQPDERGPPNVQTATTASAVTLSARAPGGVAAGRGNGSLCARVQTMADGMARSSSETWMPPRPATTSITPNPRPSGGPRASPRLALPSVRQCPPGDDGRVGPRILRVPAGGRVDESVGNSIHSGLQSSYGALQRVPEYVGVSTWAIAKEQ